MTILNLNTASMPKAAYSVAIEEGRSNREMLLERDRTTRSKSKPPIPDFATVDSAVDYVASKYKPELIIVHGPSARGFVQDTGVQMIVVKKVRSPLDTRIKISQELGRRFIDGDFIVMAPKDFHESVGVPGSFAYHSLEDGYVAYEAPQ